MKVLTKTQDVSTCVVDSLAAFQAINMNDCSLLLWKRTAIPDIDRELEPLSDDAFPDVRTHLHADRIASSLATLITTQGYDTEAAFPNWLADMTKLAEAFCRQAQGRRVTARLETLAHTGCPRFHVDHSYLRLVCTYRGAGTEWLDDDQVDRVAQRSGAPNEAIVLSGKENRMPTFAVGLLKGSRYPGAADGGLVHRSPTPAPGEPVRVLFCLDC